MGHAQNAIPVVVELKDPRLFPHKKQYPQKPLQYCKVISLQLKKKKKKQYPLKPEVEKG